MPLRYLFGGITLAAVCTRLLFVKHVGAVNVILLLNILTFLSLVIAGRRKNGVAFWSGLSGLVWLAFAAGAMWEIPIDVRAHFPPDSDAPVVFRLQFVGQNLWRQIATTHVEQDDCTIFTSTIHGRFIPEGRRLVPSADVFSRFVWCVTAWMFAALVAFVVAMLQLRQQQMPR